MKKLFLSLILAVVGTMGMVAQTDLVATLSHGSSVSTFYGDSALAVAYRNSTDGDIITLSSGTFNAVDIEKAITVRGARCLPDPSTLIEPTYLKGYFTVSLPDTTLQFMLEDVNCLNTVSIRGSQLKTASINRCYFGTACLDGCQPIFYHSVFSNSVEISTYVSSYSNGYTSWTYNNTQPIFRNCVVRNLTDATYATSSRCDLDHCVITFGSGNLLKRSIITNSVIVWNSLSNYTISSDCSVSHCVGTKNCPAMFANFPEGNNSFVDDITSVFKTLTYDYFDRNENFELTDEAAATYLGDDGKQVGIYGGTNPFDPTPTIPQITKFTVDQSVNNGKLSVKINVK